MPPYLPRILYLIAGFAWLLLLWPNQITLFARPPPCHLTLPFYRAAQARNNQFPQKLENGKGLGQAQPSACALVHAFSGYRIRFHACALPACADFGPRLSGRTAGRRRTCQAAGAAGQQFPAAAGLGGVFPQNPRCDFRNTPGWKRSSMKRSPTWTPCSRTRSASL